MIDEKNIERIFVALDRQILAAGGVPISLVVCGGTALAALGLVLRTTKDVDVLGTLEDGEVQRLDRGGYHVQDLFKLAPTSAELLKASHWVLTQDVSAGFKTILVSFLRQHGHEELAGKF